MKKHLSGGHIWAAKNDILCFRGSSENEKSQRRVVVNKNELVEFRYPHNVHFRINDNGKDVYLYLDENDFLENFVCVGQVFEEIRFRNQNSMKEIIDSRLWKPIEDLK
jgi:hypothetical protein